MKENRSQNSKFENEWKSAKSGEKPAKPQIPNPEPPHKFQLTPNVTK